MRQSLPCRDTRVYGASAVENFLDVGASSPLAQAHKQGTDMPPPSTKMAVAPTIADKTGVLRSHRATATGPAVKQAAARQDAPTTPQRRGEVSAPPKQTQPRAPTAQQSGQPNAVAAADDLLTSQAEQKAATIRAIKAQSAPRTSSMPAR